MVDTYRGQIRIRAWPRKRGKPKSEAVRAQNAWFKGANKLAKVVEPLQQNLAIAMTKGTGLYPRDLLLRQMAGGTYTMLQPGGREIIPRRLFREKKMFQGVILEFTATQNLPGLVNTILVWPLPVIDTLSFWSAGNPTRITIPAGIEAVEFTGGWADVSGGPVTGMQTSFRKNGTEYTRAGTTGTGSPAMTIARGPTPVALGDFFEMAVRPNLAQVAAGDTRTFFTLNVLQAT